MSSSLETSAPLDVSSPNAQTPALDQFAQPPNSGQWKVTIAAIIVAAVLLMSVVIMLWLFQNPFASNPTPTASDSANLQQPSTNSQYTLEYFQDAERRGKDLTAEEKQAYIKLTTPQATIWGAYIEEKEFVCKSLNSSDVIYNLYVKNQNVRLDLLDDNDQITGGMLITQTHHWFWDLQDPSINSQIEITNHNDRLALLSYAFTDQGGSEETFNKSCNYQVIDDQKFTLPSEIKFVDPSLNQ